MADELQALLDRITEDGVKKAEAQRMEILAKAKDEAAEIVKKAKDEAEQLLASANREADLLRQKSEQAMLLAARDVKLSLSAELKRQVPQAISALLGQTLQPEGLANVIASVCTSFLKDDGQQSDLQVMLPGAQFNQLVDAVKAQMAANLQTRCEFSPSRMLKNGFKLSFNGNDVVYDFSDEALTAALSEHLSPKLAALLATDKA